MTAVIEEKPEVGLPTDLEACHALIRDLVLALESRDADIAHLKERLQNLVRGKFGRSTEKLSPGQLLLFKQQLEELWNETTVHVGEEKVEEVAASRGPKPKKHGGGGRKPIAAHVTRERRDYLPNDDELTCACGNQKTEIGTVTIDQLDYIPASFKVIEHVTHKFACKLCQEGVVKGRRPQQIHSGGRPAEGLLAQISVAKYGDHLPLNRQEQIYAREGVEVSQSSMGRWLDMCAEAAKPIYERMRELVVQSKVVQADESPFLFVDKNRPAKKSKTGYVWTAYGDAEHPYTIYDFQPDRSSERAKQLLKGFTGILLTDGYSGYEWYPRELSANCSVHGRRYLEKALKSDKTKAGMALALYTNIYEIEERIRNLSEAEIVAARQAETVPLLNKIEELLKSWQPFTPPKTAMGIAINYNLPRWDKLCRFTEYGFLRPDTNLVENSIRPIAVGRKNWMQIGSEEALETASIHASLVNTCKRLGINPYLYLRDVFIRLGHGNVAIDDLLPDRWVNENPIEPTRPQEAR